MKRKMEISKCLLRAAWIMTLALSFNACKKNNDKKPVCRIIAFTLAGNVYSVTYNGNGRIIAVSNGTLSETYDYLKDTTVITSLSSGAFSSRVIVTLNSAGLASNVRTEFDAGGNEWVNDAYEYNGDEVSKRTTTTFSDSSKSIIYYTWSNHNIISQTTGSSTIPWEYYDDKPRQSGDYLDFIQFLAGYEYIKTKNLLKSIGNSTFTYDFGSDGTINSLTVNSPGGTPAALNYKYQCN